MRWFVSIAMVLAVAGCRFDLDGGNGVACTAIYVYGVNVTLTDEAGEPISGSSLTLTDGDYTETMQELREGEYAGAGERPGTYTLVAEADGFEPETLSGIVVDADECHVIPVVRTVVLNRS